MQRAFSTGLRKCSQARLSRDPCLSPDSRQKCSVPRHEHRRDRDRNDRRIKLDCTDQPGDENHAAACHGDPPGQDEFAAALDPGGKLGDLRLKLDDLDAMVAVVRGGPWRATRPYCNACCRRIFCDHQYRNHQFQEATWAAQKLRPRLRRVLPQSRDINGLPCDASCVP